MSAKKLPGSALCCSAETLMLNVERDGGFASLSCLLRFFVGTEQQVPLGLNEEYQTPSAYRKGCLVVVLQTDTGHVENQCLDF